MILGVYFIIGYIFLLLFGAAFVVFLFYRCRKKDKIKEKELEEKTLKETIKTIENLAKKNFVKKNDNYLKILKAGGPKRQ